MDIIIFFIYLFSKNQIIFKKKNYNYVEAMHLNLYLKTTTS